MNKSIITALLSSSIGAGGATLLGKTVVTNIIKFIPGAGTVIGGAISAGTAGVITAALGEAYIGIMELVFKGEMSIDDLVTKKGKDAMSTMFKEQLKMKKIDSQSEKAKELLEEMIKGSSKVPNPRNVDKVR